MMEPITVTLVTALVMGNATGLTETGNQLIIDAYNACKLAIQQKFGATSDLLNAVNTLEKKPTSRARAEAVREEIEAAGAANDPELLKLVETLQAALEQNGVVEGYEQALPVDFEISDRQDEATQFRGDLVLASRALGQVEQTIEYHEQALGLARKSSDRLGERNRLAILGNIYRDLGQVERAIEYHEQALGLARELGDRRGEANQLGNLGLAYRALGQVERALEYHERALGIFREIGDRQGEANQLGNLGLAYRALGQIERAIQFHKQALDLSRKLGDYRGEGADLSNLGLAYHALGQIDQALECQRQALKIFKAIKSPYAEYINLWLMAWGNNDSA